MSKTKSYFGVVICAFIASLFVSGLYNNIVFAASASISTTGTVSIDVSAAGNSANLGSDTLTVNTTCSTGYTVSISSSIADTTLYKDGDNTSTSKITPSTGTVTSPASILGNNLGTWGYSTTATSVQDNFIGLTNTPTIIKQSTTASGDGSGSTTTGNDTIPVYYGVSIPTSLEPGTYTMAKDSSNNPGTIVYQLTMPTECNPYIIKYNGNNNDTGTTMSVTNTVDEGQSTTLMPSNYKRAGYGFAGWNTKADGTGTDFGPMEDVTLSTSDTKGNTLIGAADTNKEITLYAKWIQSAGNIQSWTGCNSMNTGDVIALTDTRDNNVYAVAKLADGNCWMIENLRLGGSQPINLTTTDSALSTNLTLPASTDTFTTSAYTNIEMNAKNTTSPTTNMDGTDTEVYSYGNYYSYAAAIGTTAANDTNNNSATTSICPAGWHLPKGGDKNNQANNESWNLIVTKLNNGTSPANYSSLTQPYYTGNPEGTDVSKLIRKYPNNLLYSGYVYGSSLNRRGGNGRVWSSTTYSSYSAYYLTFNSTDVYPGTNYYNKYDGFSVRCVADRSYNITYNGNTTDTTTTMSVMHSSVKPNSTINLYPSNYKRGGYGFVGWSTTQLDPNDTNAAANLAAAKIYGPMETITLNDELMQAADSNGNIVLYAVWVEPAGNLQNWGGCPSLSSGAVTALTDTRDGNVYAVAKLADGKCWMIENLRLGGSTAMSLSPFDTAISASIDFPASTNTFVTNNYTTIQMSAENKLNPVSIMTTSNANIYSYGNYYSWAAAIGSTTAYSTNNQSVSTSICPSGWHLPKGGQNTVASGQSGDFYVLTTTLMGGEAPNNPNSGYAYYQGTVNRVDVGAKASSLLRTYPNNILYPGFLNGSSFSGRGSYGHYWSSTVNGLYGSYYLDLSARRVSPGTASGTKYYGFSVRCVAGS